MATEAKRAAYRIVTNYGRLIAMICLGLVYLPVVISWVGIEGFGVIAVVEASVGLAGLLGLPTSQALVRSLGAAWHGEPRPVFHRVYSSSYAISAIAAAITALAFGALVLLAGLLRLPPEWIGAARWLIITQGAAQILTILLMPAFAMYLVQERFGLYNLWLVLSRASYLASALILRFGAGIDEVDLALKAHGVLLSTILVAVQLVAVAVIVLRDRTLLPRLRRIETARIRDVMQMFSWNSGVHLAMNLHDRCAALLMNFAFGPFGSAVFDIGLRLVSYTRMATSGVTEGVDAVAARISTESVKGKVQTLMIHSTRLHAWVALPGSLILFALADPLLRLWLGRAMDDPERGIPAAVIVARVYAISIAARSISDGWMYILYGAGHIRRYAPLVLAGGFISPLVGAALLLVIGGGLVDLEPTALTIAAPPLAVAVVFTIVHFFILPAAGAPCLGMRTSELYRPQLRPAIATLLGSPIPIGAMLLVERWSLLSLAITFACYGIAYAGLTWIIVLNAAERERLMGALRRGRAAAGEERQG